MERSHGTYQDRLVKELRLAELNTIDSANELLVGGFCAQLNEKFAVLPRSSADYHRAAKGYDLAAVFCCEEERAVSADWVVRFGNQFYQLEPKSRRGPTVRRVTMQTYLNGELHIRYRGQDMAFRQLPSRPQPQRSAKKEKPPRPRAIQERVTRDNVWRGFQFGKGSPWRGTPV